MGFRDRIWTLEDWIRVIWSDECSVEIGRGKRHRWCFGINHHNEKFDKDDVTTYKKGRGMSIMIWGAIFCGGSSRIVQMQRDELAKRNGYTARSYLDVLEAELPCIYQNSDWTFMQDNAPIHSAKIIEE